MVTTKELAKLRAKAQRERQSDTRSQEAKRLTREIRQRQFGRTRTGKFLKITRKVGRATGRALDKAEARRRSKPQRVMKKRKTLNFNDFRII